MNSNLVLLFILYTIVGHVLVWLQINGQLVWKSWQDLTGYLVLVGLPISYLFIKATVMGYEGFEMKLWPIRLNSFAIGIIIFTIFTFFFLHEAPDMKSMIGLVLAFGIILVQVLL